MLLPCRAVAGLWNAGEGEVVLRAREKDVMFLPQRPYMVLGTLRDQVRAGYKECMVS
jgi:ABC-type uncharacterized transport system fused permease/ATPase subunit